MTDDHDAAALGLGLGQNDPASEPTAAESAATEPHAWS